MSSHAELSPTEDADPSGTPARPPATGPLNDADLLDYRGCLAAVLAQALEHGDSEEFIHGVNDDIKKCDTEFRVRGLQPPA